MRDLTSLAPRHKHRVYDLVRDAGVDVRHWSDYKRSDKPAANPRFCYEWSFVDPGNVIVLCLWHAEMEERGGRICHDVDLRTKEAEARAAGRSPNWLGRARKMRDAIRLAYEQRLPVRVIVLSGDRQDLKDPARQASSVQLRDLDPVPWSVTHFDPKTEASTLTRGAPPVPYVDQFDLVGVPPVRTVVSGTTFTRDAGVRRRALTRANGECEWCGEPGFVMANGATYLETHHVQPLSEGGLDVEENVVALCPNHHREAHHGERAEELRDALHEVMARRDRRAG